MIDTPRRDDAATLERFGYAQELKRQLTLKDLLIYGLVCMVPTAPFSIFGGVFDISAGMVPLTYLVGFVAMLFTALSYQQMSQAFPVAGSVYAYVGRGLSSGMGFLAGWAILLDYLLVPTLLYVVGANAMQAVLPAVPQPAWIAFFVVLNTVVNLRGIETTARANRFFLLAQLLVLAVFVVLATLAIQRGVNGAHWSWRPLYNPQAFSPQLIFSALSVAVVSFLGFDAISTMSEEARGGSRVVGRATLLALLIVAGLFVLQTWLAALLQPTLQRYPSAQASNDAFFEIGRLIAGPWLQIVIALTVAISAAIANSLVAQAATSRLLFAMARDRQLPGFLRHIHPRTGVPQRAILLVAGLSLVLGEVFVGQIALLSSLCNVGALTAFVLLHIAVLWHFRTQGRRVLHGVVPLIGILILAYVLLNADLHAQLGGAAWMAVGLTVLAFLKLSGRSTEFRASDALE
ncbi:APC family permease [Xanthomonas citri]|uniref:APC family permease n=1 Tax=Xanthomonas citri TaxID=346 RepID=UPI000C07A8C4|nr:APC family permease [Xanthomonas citri]MCT8355076.1 APC family permease [Xanthomonas citri pv. anacardii]MCT8359096.1 APC family permease [Xanthomonas citri pv. anacardii]MCT8363943.1 APC family permease [Xanthomonas citri pv. anacardii]MCT8367174.1 APC family permease [Xanthomonas citri pv. anacardii]MCT8372359.1 APC family permease [Xanthomonas citri pv. anacardii]